MLKLIRFFLSRIKIINPSNVSKEEMIEEIKQEFQGEKAAFKKSRF